MIIENDRVNDRTTTAAAERKTRQNNAREDYHHTGGKRVIVSAAISPRGRDMSQLLPIHNNNVDVVIRHDKVVQLLKPYLLTRRDPLRDEPHGLHPNHSRMTDIDFPVKL